MRACRPSAVVLDPMGELAGGVSRVEDWLLFAEPDSSAADITMRGRGGRSRPPSLRRLDVEAYRAYERFARAVLVDPLDRFAQPPNARHVDLDASADQSRGRLVMAGRQHLHHDDAPSTLAILADLLDHRASFPVGYEPTECGAWVDWDALGRSWLSSSEMAAVHIARGCAIAERHGGLPLEVAGSVRAAVEELTGGWTTTVDPTAVDRSGADAYAFADPVGLDPDHPDGSGAGKRFEEYDGPALRYSRAAQRLAEVHRRSEFPEAPDGGPGVGL